MGFASLENAWGGAPKNIGWVDRLSTTRKTESMKGSKRSRDRAACWPQMQFGVATEAETYYTLASPCGFYCKIKIEHFSASTFSVARTHTRETTKKRKKK